MVDERLRADFSMLTDRAAIGLRTRLIALRKQVGQEEGTEVPDALTEGR